MLVVDGEVHYRDASGYHASVEQLLAELKEADGGLDLTLIADSAGRRDQPADLGQIRANGRADNIANLSQWRKASVQGNLEIVNRLRLRAHAPAVDPLDVKLEFNGSLSLAEAAKFLPDGIAGLEALRSGGVRGHTELSGARRTGSQRACAFRNLRCGRWT